MSPGIVMVLRKKIFLVENHCIKYITLENLINVKQDTLQKLFMDKEWEVKYFKTWYLPNETDK